MMPSASETSLKSQVVNRAAALGFDLCRITTAQPPNSIHHYERWIQAGQHGHMSYLERGQAKRADPSLVLSDIRSIITLATSYYHASPPTLESQYKEPTQGIVARYAHYHDYHDVLAEKLTTFSNNLAEWTTPSSHSLWYVDTGPILERDLAQRAGLGFIGKHTNLISRKLGNWFFISEILTTATIPPDEPEKNRCGTCHRCLDACPTQALPQPFVLDARRCISYLTIELKGSIPESLRPLIGNRIFGCDDCLAACPWNRFAKEGQIMKSHFCADSATTDLENWAQITPEEFKRQFRGTPFYRTKWKGLMRNVCVALGNVGTATNLPTLERLRGHSESLVAEHATWAIQQITKRLNPKRDPTADAARHCQ